METNVSMSFKRNKGFLIGYLVEARDPKALGTLRQFAQRPDLDDTIRERASRATKQLTEFR